MADSSFGGIRGDLEQKLARFEQLEHSLIDPAVLGDQSKLSAVAREHGTLAKLALRYRQFTTLERQIAEHREMIAGDDADLRGLAEAELPELEAKREREWEDLLELCSGDEDADRTRCIVELRAGTGGDEAALFVRDLYEMYRRWGAEQGWDFEVMDASPTELGGFKELILGVSGDTVFRKLQHESGGHRVQRVPDTETKGRIHTSAATVAVLPEPEDVEVALSPDDYRKDLFCASGPGGQHVNKTASAVRLTHLATNIVVQCQDEKSQHKNLAKALRVLKTRLYEHERRIEHEKRATERREQVGSGDRSQRIRTYNFPQNRVTDHRINESFTLDQVMVGRLGLVVDAIERHAREKRKSEMEQSAKPAAT
ncbi:MAG: peptide chain release factor 1 [Planctomycetota bacterium]|jgi:peptide chain release factor 1|nr:MAG: peptide chain release factor 1 [Planctomycetota bacterium]